jgi:hypothetical protein
MIFFGSNRKPRLKINLKCTENLANMHTQAKYLLLFSIHVD